MTTTNKSKLSGKVRRIGLPDKLVQVSSPILLALQLIDTKDFQCVFSTAAVLSSAAHLPIRYLKPKTRTHFLEKFAKGN